MCQSFNFLFAKSRMGFQPLSVDCRDFEKILPFYAYQRNLRTLFIRCYFSMQHANAGKQLPEMLVFYSKRLKNEIYPHIYGLIWQMVSTKQKILEEN